MKQLLTDPSVKTTLAIVAFVALLITGGALALIFRSVRRIPPPPEPSQPVRASEFYEDGFQSNN